MRDTPTGRPVVEVEAGRGVGAAATTTLRIPPPRKRVRFSKRLAWRLATRVLMAGALIALVLLVAAPERHEPCTNCLFEYLRSKGVAQVVRLAPRAVPKPGQLVVSQGGRMVLVNTSGPAPQAFLFREGTGNCHCYRHPELAEWFAILRELVFPNSAPAAAPSPGAAGPAIGGGAGGLRTGVGR